MSSALRVDLINAICSEKDFIISPKYNIYSEISKSWVMAQLISPADTVNEWGKYPSENQ